MPNTCRWVSPVGDTNKGGSTQVCACVCVCVYVHKCVYSASYRAQLVLCLHISQSRNNIGTI